MAALHTGTWLRRHKHAFTLVPYEAHVGKLGASSAALISTNAIAVHPSLGNLWLA